MTKFRYLSVLAGMVLGVIGVSGRADDSPKAISSDAGASLAAKEFSSHLDADAVVVAFRAGDSDALLAAANRLAAAEHAAAKTNQPLPAINLYRLAIQVAQNGHNVKGLDRLQKSVSDSKHLAKGDKEALLAEIQLAQKLAAGERKIDAGPGLKASEVSAEAIALYNTFVRELRITQDYGTEEDLALLIDGIGQLRELHPKQRDHLKKLATTTRVAIRERTGSDPAYAALASVSRNATSGLRVLGPTDVPVNGQVTLVILGGGTAARPGQLHLRASKGVTVPEVVEWTGKPLVIQASIKTSDKGQVYVSVGRTERANEMTWIAQAALE